MITPLDYEAATNVTNSKGNHIAPKQVILSGGFAQPKDLAELSLLLWKQANRIHDVLAPSVSSTGSRRHVDPSLRKASVQDDEVVAGAPTSYMWRLDGLLQET